MNEQKNYTQRLHPDVWKHLPLDLRRSTLQALENDHAKQAGREPWQVRPVQWSNPYIFGEIDPKGHTLQINKSHIQAHALVCMVAYTVLHEGRHAYQQTAMQNKGLHPDAEQVRLWIANRRFYIRSDKNYAAYKFQPLERDAERYATTELIKLYSELERQHGTIETYQQTIKHYQIEMQKDVEEAKMLFGADYEARIDWSIMREYQKQLTSQQQKTDPTKDPPAKIHPHNTIYRIDVQLPNGSQHSKLFKVDQQPDIKHLRSATDRGAKRFVEQMVIRKQVAIEDIKHLKVGVSKVSQDQAEQHVKKIDRGIDKCIE